MQARLAAEQCTGQWRSAQGCTPCSKNTTCLPLVPLQGVPAIAPVRLPVPVMALAAPAEVPVATQGGFMLLPPATARLCMLCVAASGAFPNLAAVLTLARPALYGAA